MKAKPLLSDGSIHVRPSKIKQFQIGNSVNNNETLSEDDCARVPCTSYNEARVFLSLKANAAQLSKETADDQESWFETSQKKYHGVCRNVSQ